jgi:hypothetical protein
MRKTLKNMERTSRWEWRRRCMRHDGKLELKEEIKRQCKIKKKNEESRTLWNVNIAIGNGSTVVVRMDRVNKILLFPRHTKHYFFLNYSFRPQ